MISEKNLDFCIKYGYNVLLRGKAGVGKTHLVLDAFNRSNLKWIYFSAATMDPFCDFVGIPKEHVDPVTGVSYLDLVRPKVFAEDQVEAIFLDEFNRSSKKVRNAVLELIQFKSINGKKFNNLKVVWAAINPEEEDGSKYDVEALDPAQLDRFHMVIDVPYKPDPKYFNTRYGKEIGEAAVNWWEEQPEEIKNLISPRRLDYAIDIHSNDGDIKLVLPKKCNTQKLILELRNGPIVKNLEKIRAAKDVVKAKTFLASENNFNASIEYIVKNPEYVEFFTESFSEEKTLSSLHAHNPIKVYVFNNPDKFEGVIEQLSKSGTSKYSKQATELMNFVNRKKMMSQAAGGEIPASGLSEDNFAMMIEQFSRYANSNTSTGRKQLYNQILRSYTDVSKQDNLNKVFGVLTGILTKSQPGTLTNEMPHLIPMINQTIKCATKFNLKIDKTLVGYGQLFADFGGLGLIDVA